MTTRFSWLTVLSGLVWLCAAGSAAGQAETNTEGDAAGSEAGEAPEQPESAAAAGSGDEGAPPGESGSDTDEAAPPAGGQGAESEPLPEESAPEMAQSGAAAPGKAPGLVSTVLVRSAGESGVGVVVHSARHVVAPFHVVARGREVQVRLQDGTEIAATPVAVDEKQGLALLELNRDAASLEPTPLASGAPAAGTAVSVQQPVHVHRHHHHELRWAKVKGEVATEGEGTILVASPVEARRGAAVVDSSGRLVGMARHGGWGKKQGLTPLISAETLGSFVKEGKDSTEPYDGHFRPFVRFGWSGQFRFDDGSSDDFNLHGPTFTFGMLFRDRWTIELDANFLFLDFGDDNAALKQDINSYQAELTVGHRFLLTDAGTPTRVYFTPSIGGLVDWTRTEVEQLQADGMGGFTVAETEDDDVFFRPVAKLAFTLFGHLELAASAQIDIEDPDETRFGIFAGFGY
jgi:hypothetical protein